MIYCASDRVGAFGETLAQFRVSLSTIANLSRDVEDEESSDSELEDIVDPQDSTRRVLLASEWCASRQVGHILIHNSLRFVDIMAAESLSHL